MKQLVYLFTFSFSSYFFLPLHIRAICILHFSLANADNFRLMIKLTLKKKKQSSANHHYSQIDSFVYFAVGDKQHCLLAAAPKQNTRNQNIGFTFYTNTKKTITEIYQYNRYE